MKLQKLEIKSFRGASKPLAINFESQKPITMVFGENGNGKSSIADALICLCTESIGSLEDKSSTDRKFLRTLNTTPSDVQISLSTDIGDFSAQLNVAGSTFVKNPVEGLPHVRHLRRKQVTQLLDAEPSDRYKELQDYIDVTEIMKCEDTLRSHEKSTKTALKAQQAVEKEAAKVLSQIWEGEGKPNESWLEWAKNEAGRDIAELNTKLHCLNSYLELWRATATSIQTFREAVLRERAAERTLANANKSLDEFLQANPGNDVRLIKLLAEAQSYIEPKEPLEICPVCGNDVVKTELLEKIKLEIASMRNLQALHASVNSASTAYISAVAHLNTSEEACYSSIDHFCATVLPTIQSYFPENVNLFNDYTVLATKNLKREYLKIHIPDFQTAFSECDLQQKEVDTKVKQHNNISVQYRSHENAVASVESTSEKLSLAQQALAIVENCRKDFVNSELNSISGTVENLYMKIHPDEPIGNVILSLNTNFKQSVDIHGRFVDLESVKPQSLYSESHLDTLGLCIFLALAKKYHEANTILILDDVLMSVDHNHLERVIGILHEDLEEFSHIILTTHYRPWRDLYRHGRAPSGKVQFVELLPWSIERGIRFHNGKSNLEELREALASDGLDRQKLCSISGIILENIFDFLSVKYQCKLPRKPKGDYVLRELTDCLDRALQRALKVQFMIDASGVVVADTVQSETDLQPLISRLKELAIIRNWVGAHFNPDAAGISDPEVLEFAELTLKLGELLTCPIEGGFPVKSNSGIYHATRTGSIRMFPFVQPT